MNEILSIKDKENLDHLSCPKKPKLKFLIPKRKPSILDLESNNEAMLNIAELNLISDEKIDDNNRLEVCDIDSSKILTGKSFVNKCIKNDYQANKILVKMQNNQLLLR